VYNAFACIISMFGGFRLIALGRRIQEEIQREKKGEP
jgi:hypothetical protein